MSQSPRASRSAELRPLRRAPGRSRAEFGTDAPTGTSRRAAGAALPWADARVNARERCWCVPCRPLRFGAVSSTPHRIPQRGRDRGGQVFGAMSRNYAVEPAPAAEKVWIAPDPAPLRSYVPRPGDAGRGAERARRTCGAERAGVVVVRSAQSLQLRGLQSWNQPAGSSAPQGLRRRSPAATGAAWGAPLRLGKPRSPRPGERPPITKCAETASTGAIRAATLQFRHTLFGRSPFP